ncbi:MAG: ATP-binding protein [Bdellovibrio sp.]
MFTKKVLFSFALAITLSILTFGIIFYAFGDKLLSRSIDNKVKEVDAEFHETFTRQESLLTALVETISNEPPVVHALNSKNRNQFYDQYKDIYEKLKISYGVTHFSLHLPDHTNLVRVHLPNTFGDLVERSSLIKASATGKVAKGLEQGFTGNITLRVVKPIFYNKKVIGYLELGTDISYLLNLVHENLSVGYTILIAKKFLDKERWIRQTEKSSKHTSWNFLKDFVVAGISEEKGYHNLLRVINELEKTSSEDYLDFFKGEFWTRFPLYNLDNERLGYVLIHGSISDIVSPLFKLYSFAVLIFLAITALLFYTSWKILNNLIQGDQAIKHSAQMSSVGVMASEISHEIANPVTTISLCTFIIKEVLEKDPLDKTKISEMVDRIDKMTERISKINMSMRLVSRNRPEDPLVPTSIKTVILETLEICKEKFYHENIPLLVNDIPEISVKCRGFQISQVLLNLLNNARDAIKDLDEKWVDLKVEVEDGIVRIAVTDSGKGIPDKVAEKIMSPFFTTKPVDKGTGLGLSLSQEIIREHHGKLYYDSSCSHTRFVIELPI